MAISARNSMEGVIKEIKKGEVAATVKVEVTKPSVITSMITRDAVDSLGLKVGQKVKVIVKSTEVMIGVDE
ncbi:MAG: TOBE domain protein [Candidatus Methanofastidiosum methylothiophilum]|jgi:molybdopterin-binding protein|uniref:TOBE domain protein n=1 Tax=Candidatus Methanofastidiosum methylothiophilum TaxID=1705564 RepID=A0A150JBS8_9EURY|nr:MAG: TOBE domain protein [Candidatus Methanofastidiosum methylthiophilus]MBP6932077.1 TOBE domain-containing protein [Methanofastidiosum sp.]OQC51931.1 MAG: TOBE domain protein [Euryarchaeota archaeon ADurb.Bin023]KYC56082.1 MAG: TOBE domain protein [Candidatus Methanofastidiosum methylthiophilus]KYC57058.1 MAG: TOBE domain protein [Candidatus Methanofastidiosum methylthiophilus]